MRIALITAALALACSAAHAQTPQASNNVAWDHARSAAWSTPTKTAASASSNTRSHTATISGASISTASRREFGGNGPLDGYWSEPDVSHDDDDGGDGIEICPFGITDGEGRFTNNWGRIRIVFTDVDFPSDFVLMRGRCFQEPADAIPGKRAN
jgi:hypothetical protein